MKVQHDVTDMLTGEVVARRGAEMTPELHARIVALNDYVAVADVKDIGLIHAICPDAAVAVETLGDMVADLGFVGIRSLRVENGACGIVMEWTHGK